ncbi:MAG: chitobiase/beta-hexosaminidase C-terminal domain-containing protein, partial [Planctomycetes bacterium]|nr:chitobiase/beta-hexosaminidase C-terminal domain-containing protein [Planctomycetota bacterium]
MSTQDFSGNGYSGSLTNMAADSWRLARIYYGLDFDGIDDYVEFDNPNFDGITGSASRTVTAWIKTSELGNQHIISWGTANTGKMWLLMIDQNNNNALRAVVFGGTVIGSTPIADGAWHHIAVVLADDGSADVSEVKLYVDGKLETISSSTALPIDTASGTNVRIGTLFDSSPHFKGLIDDVRIYDHPLSGSEIQGLSDIGVPTCLLGDLNNTCKVSWDDLLILFSQWLDLLEDCTGVNCGDLNDDDIVNVIDYTLLADNWQKSISPIAINELMASNGMDSGISDEQGDFDDWFELYNRTSGPIDVGGMYLTDNLASPTKWKIPDNISQKTTIPSGGFLMFWADNEELEGPFHVNFKLSAGGEEIGLFSSDGATLIDSITFGSQNRNISYGRYTDGEDLLRFFSTATPEAPNDGNFLLLVADTKFSVDRGFYDAAFSVAITVETPGSAVRFTTDGTNPTLTNGTTYTGPIFVSSTTTLRASAFKNGWVSSNIDTHTYLFISDVITQSPNGQKPGTHWPASGINGQVLNYGMDPDIVNDARYTNLMDDALLAIPSISFVTDLDNLFHPSTGIYVNARNEGKAWERPVSVELLNPDGSKGFQIDAGMRIRGGFSSSSSNPKHAFRLFFRQEYGKGKLNYPLFGEEGANEFDNVDLRTTQNYSWAFQGDSRNTFLRDVFARDTQRDMGQPYTRSRYYHLYINGHYWGLFQTQERSIAGFAVSYFGGEKDDYDVIKHSGGRRVPTAGNTNAYDDLFNKAMAGFSTDAAYYHVQGLNPDRSPNPSYPKLVDVDSLIVYMIGIFYSGDRDAPISNFFGNSGLNNFYTLYNRNNPDGFKCFRHDAEHTLDTGMFDRT